MTRRWFSGFLLTATLAWAQPPQPQPPEEDPPEEDIAEKPKEYAFNPLQAENEIKVGKFYAKRGSWKAASMRFTEATLWDPNSAPAWLLLGEAREKLKDSKGARDAYQKFLQIAPDAKEAREVKKRLEKLPQK